MKIDMPSLMHLAGLTVYLASTGSHAAPADVGAVTVTIGEGELYEIDARARAKHSLTSAEWDHLKEVADDVANEGRFEFEFTADNPFVTDEFSVKLSDSGECRVNIHGTDGGFEWISNIATVYKTVSVNGQEILKAHAGFTIGALAVDRQLDGAILKNCGTPKVLTFLGYSRGGGIANVLAAMYYRRGDYEVQLITWASPRALSKSWANYYQNKFYQIRVVNDNDVVTTMPPTWFGYKHFGTVVCLDCKKNGQDADGGFSFNVFNHLISQYNKKIQSINV
eukprot:CFRG0698T1